MNWYFELCSTCKERTAHFGNVGNEFCIRCTGDDKIVKEASIRVERREEIQKLMAEMSITEVFDIMRDAFKRVEYLEQMMNLKLDREAMIRHMQVEW